MSKEFDAKIYPANEENKTVADNRGFNNSI